MPGAGKFIEGRVFDLPNFNNNPTIAPSTLPKDFVEVPNLGYEVHQSKATKNVTKSSVTTGSHPKTHRNFRWLPWIRGKISCVCLHGDDVLTGPFTGCWVVLFEHGGKPWVGHIGTSDNSSDPMTIQAKTAWRAAVDGNLLSPLKAFRPTDLIPTGLKGSPTWYALINSSQEGYSLVMEQTGKVNTDPVRLAKVAPAHGIAQPPF